MPDIQVYQNTNSLARAMAEHFVALADSAISARGEFNIALAGGSTPRDVYALLAGSFSQR